MNLASASSGVVLLLKIISYYQSYQNATWNKVESGYIAVSISVTPNLAATRCGYRKGRAISDPASAL
jgi:hypothetical protein